MHGLVASHIANCADSLAYVRKRFVGTDDRPIRVDTSDTDWLRDSIMPLSTPTVSRGEGLPLPDVAPRVRRRNRQITSCLECRR